MEEESPEGVFWKLNIEMPECIFRNNGCICEKKHLRTWNEQPDPKGFAPKKSFPKEAGGRLLCFFSGRFFRCCRCFGCCFLGGACFFGSRFLLGCRFFRY